MTKRFKVDFLNECKYIEPIIKFIELTIKNNFYDIYFYLSFFFIFVILVVNEFLTLVKLKGDAWNFPFLLFHIFNLVRVNLPLTNYKENAS